MGFQSSAAADAHAVNDQRLIAARRWFRRLTDFQGTLVRVGGRLYYRWFHGLGRLNHGFDGVLIGPRVMFRLQRFFQ
jgi:hypothetical protein